MSASTLSPNPVSPPANRPRRPGWRDPRLAIGVGLVAGCGLLGARLVGGADDTVAVWTVRADTVAGSALAAAELERLQVHFDSVEDAGRYLSADDPLPAQAVLTRDVGAGELVPISALGRAHELELVELPLTVAAEAVPDTVRTGAVVDVWVTPREGGKARRVLDDVPVVALPVRGATLGSAAERQVIVGLDHAQQRELPSALGAIAAGTVVVTRQAGR